MAEERGYFLVERGGEVRSFNVPAAYLDSVVSIVRNNIHREMRFQSDESRLYLAVGKELPRTKPSIIRSRNMRGAT